MFINQAFKGKNELWRFLLTTALTSGLFIANFIIYFFVSKEQINESYQLMAQMPKNQMLITTLLPFIFLLGLLFYLVRFFHQRSIVSLTTSREKVDFKRILISFCLIVFFNIGCFAVSFCWDNSNIVWNFNFVEFIKLLFISCLFFPFQIAFEEYLFRGFLMQQIGVLVKNRWFPLLFTSIVFGLFHGLNPEVDKLGYGVLIFYIGTGLLLGIITLMDEGLELALGFHLGNNLVAALLITSDFSVVQTNAIFKYATVQNTTDILNEMLVSIVIVYPIILFIFVKKFNWINWNERLFGKITQKYE